MSKDTPSADGRANDFAPADRPHMNARVLLLAGWLNSDDGHWQSHWERNHGWPRVLQDDWQWPRRGDWMARLEEAVLIDELLDRRPVVLVAHSLGCHLIAAWAAHSKHVARVVGALLVAPPDTERDDMPPQLFSWCPMVRRALPFPAQLLFSSNDPYCASDRAQALAAGWGASATNLGPLGHINAASGLGAWEAGAARVRGLAGPCDTPFPPPAVLSSNCSHPREG